MAAVVVAVTAAMLTTTAATVITTVTATVAAVLMLLRLGLRLRLRTLEVLLLTAGIGGHAAAPVAPATATMLLEGALLTLHGGVINPA